MSSLSSISEELGELDGQISDIFRALANGFQKLEKIKDANRQSRQLEELTEKMWECKRLIKEFDREVKDLESRNDPNTHKMLNEKKQSVVAAQNALENWATERGISFDDFSDLCNKPEAAKVAKKARLEKFEIPAKIKVLSEPWTPESGLVTAALKLKRDVVRQAFAEELKQLYAKS